MQYIMSSLVFESLSLVVEESAYCATQRYRRTRACRRFKTGNQAQQVRNENKETEGHQKRSKPFTVVADNFLALPFNEPVRPFEDVLQRAGLIHRQSRPNQQKQHHQDAEHHYFHGNRIRDRRLRVFGLDMQRPQQSRDRPRKGMVQEFRKPELFRHESAIGRPVFGNLKFTCYGHVQLITGFARDGRHGQEQARQKPVETRGRNTQYSIGSQTHQKVTQQKTQHDSLP